MLVINYKPVHVDIGPPQSSPPYSRRRRLREVDCLNGPAADAAMALRVCRPDDNGMYDQRVRRGSNFVRARQQPSAPEPSAAVRRKLREARDRLLRKLRLQRDAMALHGKHVDVQCNLSSPEDLEIRPPASEGATQTDLTPGQLQQVQRSLDVIVRCKTGLDVATQVVDRDLIDFETEVFPLTKILVARVLEQAAVCVLYEDDVVALRREQAVYEKRRMAELVEIKKLEHDEAIQRKRGLRALERAERAAPGPTYRALHSRAFAQQYMAGLRDDALGQLVAAGYLRGDDHQFTGWLRGRINDQNQRRANTDARLNALICNVIVKHSVGTKRPASSSTSDV